MAHDSFARIEITPLCQTMLQLVSAMLPGGYGIVKPPRQRKTERY